MLSCCPDLYTPFSLTVCVEWAYLSLLTITVLFWFSKSLAFMSSIDWAIFTRDWYDIYSHWLYNMRSVDLWISLQQTYIYDHEKIYKCNMASQFKMFSLKSWDIIHLCNYNSVCINNHILQIIPNFSSSQMSCSTALIILLLVQGKEQYVFFLDYQWDCS